MRISIIMPCYNAAHYLRPCLDSVLAQTMGDFELLLIDDGSKDDTLSIARAYAEKDARMRVFHQENAGVSAARNLGLDHARGEWVTFVDGDDLLMPDALSLMLSAAQDDVDMVVCAHRTFDENGAQETVIPESRWMDRQGDAKRRAAALRLIEGDSVLNIMCNKLHRRSMIERESLRLQPGLRIAEDALFNLEAVLCGQGVAYLNRATYLYRTHAASATQTRTDSEYDRHLPWMQAMRRMLLQRNLLESYYGAYLDSVVLRLYKDGGVAGVIRDYAGKAAPLVSVQGLDRSRMCMPDRLLAYLVRTGAYPYVYPLIYPAQVIRRKASETAFRLRAQKEMPV